MQHGLDLSKRAILEVFPFSLKQDNFLLNCAVHLLKRNENIEYFTVGTPDYRDKGLHFIAERYKEWQRKNLKGF